MRPATEIALLALAYLMVKHAVADFMLQTPYQWRNKGRYGHPGGLLHCAIHAACTAPVFWIVGGLHPGLMAAILSAEYVLHYHIDWLKEAAVRSRGWRTTDDAYWRAMGLDQMAHGLTYVAMVWVMMMGGR